MIKAAPNLLCLFVIIAFAPQALVAQTGQRDPVTTAAEEGVRREADAHKLRQTLVLAQSAWQQNDLPASAKLYEDCYVLVQKIGPAVEVEGKQVTYGLTTVLLSLAIDDQKQKQYKVAQERLDRILVIDPHNQAALDCRRNNRQLLDAQAGTIPSPEVTELIPAFRTNEIRIATMVQDGKLFYEAGKLDEAEAKLMRAYTEDPSNVAAYHYLMLIKEKRFTHATRNAEASSRDAILQVEKSWDVEQRNGQLIPRPNSFNRTNLVYTTKGRQNIISKLDRIRLDSVKFDNVSLSDVINSLRDSAKSRDPDKTGINFFIDRQALATVVTGPTGGIDPATGLPVGAAAAPEQVDIASVSIKMMPAMDDIRLADVLDAITKTADRAIKYSILDYAVVFSLRSQEPIPLEVRTFHVDPNTFQQGLESVSGIPFGNITTTSGGGSGGGSSGGGSSGSSGTSGGSGGVTTLVPQVNVASGISGGAGIGGGGGGNSGGGAGGAGGAGIGGIRFVTSITNRTELINTLARQYFVAAGIDLATNNPANVGKAIFFNDRKGILTVKATAQDLDMIEAAVQGLNTAPPQINIKAKFAEITQTDSKALGFQWTLGNTLLGGGAVSASGGTQPSLNTPSGTFPGTAFPGGGNIPAANTLIPPAASDGNLTSGLRSAIGSSGSVPTIGTITGILTDPQFRVAIQALDQRDGTDLLTAPEVTTESGRQAQMQAVDLQTIVTANNAQTGGGGFGGVQSGVNSPIVQQSVTIQPQTSVLPFGPVLDVIPYVSADEFSVQMTIIPTVTEFLGYDDPGQFVVQAQVGSGTPITAQLPLPHFRMRQVTTSVTVWDAQTVVMGGLMTDSVSKLKDKVPLLGDLPLVGRLFRSESSQKSKKNLMIFVTPTIINPDGTRYHSDEEMPFAQTSIPIQRPISQ
jgi:type II secretory pathway component GspD/PulD (secretin)/tetratricopeptide (TPR) repeat protein